MSDIVPSFSDSSKQLKGIYGDLALGKKIVLHAINTVGTPYEIRRKDGTALNDSSFAFGSIEKAAKAANKLDDAGAEVYVNCALSKNYKTGQYVDGLRGFVRYGRGKRSEADSAPSLWVDIDVKEGNAGSTEEALSAFASYGLFKPTVVIGSGNGGLHCWWRLKEPFSFNSDADRDRFEAISKGWQEKLRQATGWDIDATFDIGRMLRVAGTHNRKVDCQPVPLISADGPTYSIDSFAEYAPPSTRRREPQQRQRTPQPVRRPGMTAEYNVLDRLAAHGYHPTSDDGPYVRFAGLPSCVRTHTSSDSAAWICVSGASITAGCFGHGCSMNGRNAVWSTADLLVHTDLMCETNPDRVETVLRSLGTPRERNPERRFFTCLLAARNSRLNTREALQLYRDYCKLIRPLEVNESGDAYVEGTDFSISDLDLARKYRCIVKR